MYLLGLGYVILVLQPALPVYTYELVGVLTRRDMLEKRTTQHQYMDEMDHSVLYQAIMFFGEVQVRQGNV